MFDNTCYARGLGRPIAAHDIHAGLNYLIAFDAVVLFTPLLRSQARGGMIEARQLWPLACGITAIIAALILGL